MRTGHSTAALVLTLSNLTICSISVKQTPDHNLHGTGMGHARHHPPGSMVQRQTLHSAQNIQKAENMIPQ